MFIAIWCGEVVVGASVPAVGAPLVFQIVFIYFWKEVYTEEEEEEV